MTLGAGSEERGFAGFRYGTALGEGTYGRVYAKGFKRDEFVHTAGDDANDDWDMLRSGFRVDSQLFGRNALTLQGDFYQGNIDQSLDLVTLTPPYSQSVKDECDVSGWNMVARWQHTLSSTSEFTLQAYYDRTDRDEAWECEVRDTFDIDFQHRFAAGEWQDIIWGLGYRYTRDDFTNSLIMTVDPDSSSDELLNAFLQDEIMLLKDRLWLTLGSKLEYNDYTGFEIQPNARLLWAPHPKHKIWAAVSRAVRTPSRAEHDIRLLNTVLPPFSPDNPS
ncbi:MAG: TonB-dependent receptor, partial [Deltaproteobacteria bacterium]|nr:TonB-dependent receptor [Deltaproteobacteria bacterium]MBW1938796.1 TonB-dependent receptor [Deltaproteobacteria bacterium]